MSVEIIPQALQKIEYLIAIKKDLYQQNQAKIWDLQREVIELRNAIQDLEIQKYELVLGRRV